MAHRCISALEDAGFIYKDMISWEKETAPHRAQRISEIYKRRGDFENMEYWEGWRVGNLRPIFEPILWFMKPYKQGGTLADNVVEFGVGAFENEVWKSYNSSCSNIIKIKSSKDDHGLHPTQKPIALMEALIQLVTREGQTVLDPFMGSGSTVVAAKKLNRKYIGFELNNEFYEMAKERIITS